MDKKMFLSWIEEGVVPIPSFLFTYYKKIGLTDLECMVLLHIYTFIKKGNDFPHTLKSQKECVFRLRSALN